MDFQFTDSLAMRLLLVEDSEEDRTMLKRFLQPYTSSFGEAESLDEALRMCHSNTYDCIFLDLMLKGTTGVEDTLEGIREIKRAQPNCGVIVCSGMPIPDLKERSIAAGADHYLQKSPDMFRESGKALLVAVCVAMMHHGNGDRMDTFLAHTRLLQAIASAA